MWGDSNFSGHFHAWHAREQQEAAQRQAEMLYKAGQQKFKNKSKVGGNFTELIYNQTTDCWEPEIKLLEGE